MKNNIYQRYGKTRARHNRETGGQSGLIEAFVELRSQSSDREWKELMRKPVAAAR